MALFAIFGSRLLVKIIVVNGKDSGFSVKAMTRFSVKEE